MNKLNKLISSLIITILLSLIIVFFVEIKIGIAFFCALSLVLAYRFYKDKIGQELVIAFLFSLIVTSYFSYEYTKFNFSIGTVNIFPLISWTFGLVLLREIYEKSKNKLIISCLIYWVSLFILEYIGYYLLGIRLNSSYPSLLGLGIIHGSLFLKIFYIVAGPVYLLITDYLKVK